MARPPAILPARLADDAGVSLIEVLVSAVLVVVIATAVFAGLDSSSKASGLSKSRAIAANLASQDQDRLRSMRGAELAALGTVTAEPTPVAGVDYTVTSEAAFVTEASGSTGCAASGQASYMKIVSSVTWPARPTGTRPVRIESLLSPPVGSFGNRGNAVVIVRNAAGAGVPSLTVNLSGQPSRVTDALGCAYFSDVPSGDYTVSYSQSGWVDPSGTRAVSFPLTVPIQGTGSAERSYDRAASIKATFYTQIDPAVNGTAQRDSTAAGFSVEHAQMPGGRRSAAVPTPAPLTAITGGRTTTVGNLFPFKDAAYGLFTGSCDVNRAPADVAGFKRSQVVVPGGTYDLKVFQPAFDLTVTSGVNTNTVSGATVTFISLEPSCPGTFRRVTIAGGKLQWPGLPYGTYKVCADHQVSGQPRRFVQSSNTSLTPAANRWVNDDPLDRNIDLTIPTTGAEGSCPTS